MRGHEELLVLHRALSSGPMRGPIEWAVEEARRVAKLPGIKTISIPTTMVGRPYSSPDYEPLWATLEEIGQPVSIHIGTTSEPLYDRFLKLGVGVGVVEATGQLGMAELIWAGIPQRYRKLRFIMAEAGIGWIPTVLGHVEEDRPRIVLVREGLIPMERLMWGADYPHTEGTFPRSQQAIAKDFTGLDEADLYKLVVGNATELYGLA